MPAVWDKLPDRVAFPRHLEAKAGLPPGHWPPGMQAWRYRASEHRRRVTDLHGRSAA